MSAIDTINGVEGEVIAVDDIFIPGTKQTPEIICKKKTGEVSFRGNFISSNPNELIAPIQKWLYSFTENEKKVKLTLTFYLTYLNGSSGKSLCKLFQQVEGFQNSGVDVNVEFYCEEDDYDMLDWVKEMKSSYHLQFNLSKVN